MSEENTKKAAPKKARKKQAPQKKPAEKINLKYEILRAHYLATGSLRAAGAEAGYSADYVNAHYASLKSKLEADPEVQRVREEIKASGVFGFEERRDFLHQIALKCAQAEPVLDREGGPTGEWVFDSRGAIAAVDVINKMDGVYVSKVNHSGRVKHQHGTNPDELSPAELEFELANLLGKAAAAGSAEGEGS